VAEKNGLIIDREMMFHDMPHLVYRLGKSQWKSPASSTGN